MVWGGKMGDQKTYFVYMQDHFNYIDGGFWYFTERNGTYGINGIEICKFFKGSKKYILSKRKKYPGNSFHARVNRG